MLERKDRQFGLWLWAGIALIALALFAAIPSRGAFAGMPASPLSKGLASQPAHDTGKGARPMASTGTMKGAPANNGYQRPNAPINFILDDGTIDNSIGFGTTTTETAALWLNRFTPVPSSFPLTLSQIQIFWPPDSLSGGSLIGFPVKLLVYSDADGDGNPVNATKLAEINSTIAVSNSFQTYPVNVPVAGPGDIYIGFEDFWAEPGFTPKRFPAAIDTTASQLRSWVIAMASGAAPNRDNLALDDSRGTIETLSGGTISGNWMIRASGTNSLLSTSTPTRTSTATATSTNSPTATPIPCGPPDG